jgi:hypothetical protein
VPSAAPDVSISGFFCGALGCGGVVGAGALTLLIVIGNILLAVSDPGRSESTIRESRRSISRHCRQTGPMVNGRFRFH